MAEEHFARDKELLDRFVLGTLEEAERARCERHLAGCGTCRQTVEDDKRIVAGIKRYGRDLMKERLRRATGAEMPVRIHWARIVGVAAALVFITGIGIIYRWRELAGEGTERAVTELSRDEPSQPAVVSPGTAPTGGAATDKVMRDEETAKKSAKEQDASGTHTPPRSKSKDFLDGRETTVAPLTSNEPIARESYPMAAAKPAEALQGKLEKDQGQDNFQQLGAQKGQIRQSFWVQGVPIPSPSTFGPSARSRVMRETERADANSVKSDEKSAASGGLKQAQVGGGITLDQKPARALPLEQQVQAPGITTEVEARDDRTVMTLYLDTLLDPPAVQEARVQYVGRDSLIVIVGGRMIGYRMPAGWPGARDTSRQITR